MASSELTPEQHPRAVVGNAERASGDRIDAKEIAPLPVGDELAIATARYRRALGEYVQARAVYLCRPQGAWERLVVIADAVQVQAAESLIAAGASPEQVLLIWLDVRP